MCSVTDPSCSVTGPKQSPVPSNDHSQRPKTARPKTRSVTERSLIQRDGCSTLAALCFHKADNARQHIIDIGGLDSCIQALNDKHSSHRGEDDCCPSLQAAGCNLIGSLWLRPDVRKSVVDKGGLAAVLKAMENHKQNELVQSVGFKALFTLLRLESMWDKVAVDAGSIEAVVRLWRAMQVSLICRLQRVNS